MKNILIGLFILYSLSGVAQGDFSDAPKLPNKPGAHYIKPLLQVINTGNKDKIEAFIQKNYEPGFRDRHPMVAHVNHLWRMHANQGKLVYQGVRRYKKPLPKSEMVVILKAQRTELWQAITLKITTQKPYKITRVRLSPARPSVKPGPLTMQQAIIELKGYVKRMAQRDVFSGSVLLAKGDKVLYKAAYGLASKRFNVPNNVQTKFNLGSMNKMFTATAIMQLVQAGKLSLSDKLSKFADESWLPKEMTDKIEIRHLLTHTSGLGSYFNRTYMKNSKNNYRVLADYKPLIKNEKLRFEPGTNWGYSNTGMFMLGVVIEKISGQSYFDYIRKHIYKPAGMINTDSYEMDQPVPNLAIGYEPNDKNETGWKNNIYQHVLKGGPAGGGFSTVEDLHRFALALTNYKLLSKQMTAQLYAPKPKLNSPRYGYGFSVRGAASERIVGHGGGFLGISANLDIHLAEGYVVAVMSNYGTGARPIERKITELLKRVKDRQ
ncbi:MAG TPA: serine hydrolase [Microscillaceae bacterium]|nr:serine hydrolase [Microscillaceae bacterium]